MESQSESSECPKHCFESTSKSPKLIPSYSFLRQNSDDFRRKKIELDKIQGPEFKEMTSLCRKSNSIQALSERDPRELENQTNEIVQLVSDSSSSL